MKETGILFTSQMVLAILNDRKFKTRRTRGLEALNSNPDLWRLISMKDGVAQWSGPGLCRGVTSVKCPYGKPGDLLWVRETWRPSIAHSHGMDACDCADVNVLYVADGSTKYFRDEDIPADWTMPKAAHKGNVSPLFLPRWAARLCLEITDIKPSRVLDIDEQDALAEGFVPSEPITQADIDEIKDPMLKELATVLGVGGRITAKGEFLYLWDRLNKKNGCGTDKNPWNWELSFKRIEKPMEVAA